MEFRLLYCRSGSGKTSYIFNDIKEKIDVESKIYIIVPEQFSFSAENHLLESIDQKSSINAEVLTLSRMADRVISDVIGNSTTHLSKVGKTMIVYDCLEKLRNNLNFLRSSDKNIDVASRMITEFKKHNVKSSDLATILEKLRNKYLELKLTDSKNILDRYQDRIEGNFLDEADKLDLLAQNIELVDYFNNAIIYIDEFAGFTPNEFQIIEKLCTLAKEITITICTDSLEKVDNASESIYYFNQITAEKLLETAKRTGAFIEKINMGESKKFKNSELRVLERNIYSLNQDKILEETQDINLFIAKNPTSEIEHVAKCILRLVKQRKYRYKDIAVVAANVSNYSDDIKNIFKKYNIPVFIDEKKDLNQNIIVQYILSILDIYIKNYSFDSIFNYLKT
jgi:ATP-dependent helicase/nuclease subunit B